jgi:hypothetical protein
VETGERQGEIDRETGERQGARLYEVILKIERHEGDRGLGYIQSYNR